MFYAFDMLPYYEISEGMNFKTVLGYLLTWSIFEAAKTAPWPTRGLYDFGKFLDPSDE